MTADDRVAQQMLAATAALLDQGQAIDRLSRLLTAGTLIGLVAMQLYQVGVPLAATVAIALVALAGLAQTYLAIRVGFDAALFRQLAAGAPDLADFDGAMVRLGLLPAANKGRPLEARIAGARHLFLRQAGALALQVVLILASALFAALS
jgi:hypothetical protein